MSYYNGNSTNFNQETTNETTQRRFPGFNGYLDHEEDNHRHMETQFKHLQLNNNNPNPYLVDPRLDHAVECFSPQQNERYLEQHSVKRVDDMLSPHEVTQWCEEEEEEAEEEQDEEKATIVRSDNPYHPSNYYVNNAEEKSLAAGLVDEFRISPRQRKHAQPHAQKHHQRERIGIDDHIPGQEMINSQNFSTLKNGDTVLIQNDDGDWEVTTVIKIEETGSYDQHTNSFDRVYVATFKTGQRQIVVWQSQSDDEFVMARYTKEESSAANDLLIEDKYTINNIFKVKVSDECGFSTFVLKKYDKDTGLAHLKDVKTGKMHQLNLHKLQHTLLGV